MGILKHICWQCAFVWLIVMPLVAFGAYSLTWDLLVLLFGVL